MRRKMLLVTKHSQLCILGVHGKANSLLFCSLQGLNLSIFALSTGVEKGAIEED